MAGPRSVFRASHSVLLSYTASRKERVMPSPWQNPVPPKSTGLGDRESASMPHGRASSHLEKRYVCLSALKGSTSYVRLTPVGSWVSFFLESQSPLRNALQISVPAPGLPLSHVVAPRRALGLASDPFCLKNLLLAQSLHSVWPTIYTHLRGSHLPSPHANDKTSYLLSDLKSTED